MLRTKPGIGTDFEKYLRDRHHNKIIKRLSHRKAQSPQTPFKTENQNLSAEKVNSSERLQVVAENRYKENIQKAK